MYCESCKHEFCWVCLGEYYGYKHSMADNGAVCGQRPFVAGVFTLIMGLTIYIKLIAILSSTFKWMGFFDMSLGSSDSSFWQIF